MKGKHPQMSRHSEAPTDNFLAWFESLSIESQREALRVAVKIKHESYGGITATELIVNAPLHIAPSVDSPLLLN